MSSSVGNASLMPPHGVSWRVPHPRQRLPRVQVPMPVHFGAALQSSAQRVVPHRSEAMLRGIAFHIHHCVVKKKQEEADAALAASHGWSGTAQCHWENCANAAKMWLSQKEFVEHIQRHARQARACGWVDHADDGAPCSEDTVQDWPRHLARCHSVNICHRAAVHYCYSCLAW